MTSQPMRDVLTDPLLTPANNYQPAQFQTVTSIDRDLLKRNIV
jgi:hypothetical protein